MPSILNTSLVSKSNIKLVKVSANHNAECDHNGSDELLSPKKATSSLYYKDFEKLMQTKFLRLIEHDI